MPAALSVVTQLIVHCVISSLFRNSAVFLWMAPKEWQKKTSFVDTKGHFVKRNHQLSRSHWSFSGINPPLEHYFFSKTSFLRLFSQCLVNAIWCLRESHPLPLFSSRIPLADPVLLRKDDKNRAAPAIFSWEKPINHWAGGCWSFINESFHITPY